MKDNRGGPSLNSKAISAGLLTSLFLLTAYAPVLTQPTASADAGSTYTNTYQNSWAVVIGIDTYQKLPRLGYAVADARAVAARLPGLGFPKENIHVLLDGEATKGRIESTFYRDLKAMGPNDRLLVYFAGHGDTVAIRGGEEGYILPADADPDALPATAIPMFDIQRIAQRLPAKHYLFVMDACFSGFAATRAADAKNVSQEYLASALSEPVVQVITAGRKGQRSIEEGGHGLFTRYLLEGLQGLADQEGRGFITAAQLAAWLEPRVVQASRGRMTPQFARIDGEGHFIFAFQGAEMRPPASDLTGTFTGTIQAKLGERTAMGPVNVTFVQKGKNLSGNWTTMGSSGQMTGFIEGTHLRAFKVFQTSPCAKVFHGNAIVGRNRNSLSGSYSGSDCDGTPFTSTVKVNRVDREARFDDRPLDFEDLVNIGMSYSQQERYEDALDYFRRAARIADEKKDEKARGVMLNIIGSLYDRLGRYADAADYLSQSLRIAERTGNLEGQASALESLGLLHATQGRLGEGQRYLERGLAASERLGDQARQVRVLRVLAKIAVQQQQQTEALRAAEKALAIAERLNMPEREDIRRERDAVLGKAR